MVLHGLASRMAAAVAVAWVVFGIPHLIAGRVGSIGIHLGTALVSGVAAVLSRRWPVIALYVMGVVSTLSLAFIAAMTGGVMAPAMAFIGLVPLLAGLLDLPSYRVSWLLIACLALVSVPFLSEWLPNEAYEVSTFERFVGPLGTAVLLFVFGGFWRRSANEQLELLEGRRSEIARQAEVLHAQRTELAEAREVAEQASAAKSRFVAMTAHELRGPLNGLLGMAHVLADTRLSSHQADLVAALTTSADGLGKVLQDLLDLSKIEAGRIDVTRQPFEPRELAADVIDTFAGTAAQKKIELASLVDESVPALVYDDAGRLRQILSNLLANAVKFTSEGEVRLEVKVEGERIVYTVRDTGRGIEPEHVERIFAPFEQVSDALLDRRAGTGLGLWISRSFVEAMGGRLRVESTPRRGSAFHVELPLEISHPTSSGVESAPAIVHGQVLVHVTSAIAREALLSLQGTMPAELVPIEDLGQLSGAVQRDTRLVVLDADRTAFEELRALVARIPPRVDVAIASSIQSLTRIESQASSMGRPTSVLMKPYRTSRIASLLRGEALDATPAPLSPAEVQGTLLVVDDDAINRKVVRFAASGLGYRVLEADGGESALLLLETRPVDVILLDLHMNGIDGAETAREIVRRIPEPGRPSLLAYTGSVNEEDRARCLSSGMSEVLMKPLDRAALAAALTRAKRMRTRRRGVSVTGEVMPILEDGVYQRLIEGMGSEEDVREMAHDLLAELDPRVSKIRDALHAADRVTIRREAHKLASAVATFGGTRLALTCKRLELVAESEPITQLETRVTDLEARSAEFAPALSALATAPR